MISPMNMKQEKEEEEIEQQQQQQLIKLKPRKKCHGNRKLQRLRKKYRVKGLKEDEIEILIKIQQANDSILRGNTEVLNNDDDDDGKDNNNKEEEEEEKKDEEEMDHSYIMNNQNEIVNSSTLSNHEDHTNNRKFTEENSFVGLTMFTPLSISSILTEEWTQPQATLYKKRSKRYNLCNDHWKQYSKLIPNYKKLSDNQFKDILIKNVSIDDHQKVKELLNNDFMLNHIRQRAELIRDISRLETERGYWYFVLNLLNTPVGVWLSEISRDFMKNNSINWDHTKTKIHLKRRKEFYKLKLRNARERLRIHLNQSFPSYGHSKDKIAQNHIIEIICNSLRALVENSLYYFRLNFQQKTILLKYDTVKANLVKSFYELNPTNQQISITQKIWNLKRKSCQRAILRRKKNHRLSVASLLLNERIRLQEQAEEEEDESFPTQSLSPVMRVICDERINNTEKRTEQLMKFLSTLINSDFF